MVSEKRDYCTIVKVNVRCSGVCILTSYKRTETHVVTVLYGPSRQNALERTAELIHEGNSVPVKLVPEPENKYDSKAIAFHCEVDGKWYLIGYVVREVLEAVHKAIQEKSILSVKFAWVKYRVVWMRPGPGFYAGIDITLNGKWPRIAMQHASTHCIIIIYAV